MSDSNLAEGYKFFGEWVYVEDDNLEEAAKAKEYLEQWKKYQLRRLEFELKDYDPLQGDYFEEYVYRPAYLISALSKYGTMGLKFAMKKKLPYELG